MSILHRPRIALLSKPKALYMALAILISTAAFTPAKAQTSPLSTIYACASITDNVDRLACFDKNVPVLKVKEEKKEIITIDAEGIKEIERDSFGFSLPSLPKLGILKSKSEKAKKVTQYYTVKSVSPSRKGVTLTMENGHVWRQINGDIGKIPKGTLTAKIKPATVGTFFISLKNEKGKGGRKGARFKRIE